VSDRFKLIFELSTVIILKFEYLRLLLIKLGIIMYNVDNRRSIFFLKNEFRHYLDSRSNLIYSMSRYVILHTMLQVPKFIHRYY